MTIRKLACAAVLVALTGTACQRTPAPADVAPSTALPVAGVPPEATIAPDVIPPYGPATVQLIERYTVEAQALSAKLRPGVDVVAAAEAAEALLAIGAQVVPAFVERNPHCGDYLAATLQVQDGWRRMDVATLERDFHKGAALPEVKGDARACYHMKNLVVRPAAALVLLSQSPPEVDAAQSEITRAISDSLLVKQG